MKKKKNMRKRNQNRRNHTLQKSNHVLFLSLLIIIAHPDRIDLEDLKSILFKRERLVSFLTNPFFDNLVRNSFVLHREIVGTVELLCSE